MPQPSSRDRFLELLRSAVSERTLTKLTLGKYRGGDPSLENLFVRPVVLKSGPQLTFLWRHATRDITKNHSSEDALRIVEPLIGHDFLDAHLFTPTQRVQFETKPDGTARIKVSQISERTQTFAAETAPTHDRPKAHVISVHAAWLRALGVTNDRSQPREGMADKFRQIQKFAELLSHLLADAGLSVSSSRTSSVPIHIVDAGCGKGYLTFALAELLGERATIRGIEMRQELVDLCNGISRESGFAPRLTFTPGTIADAPLDACDVLIALHACDTATDDALARGIAAGAKLLVVAPCCQKELRPQLKAPPVLATALRHGIFQERQAEFVTDALRAQLLECSGYRTKVFEFISTEHTAKNLMIAAIKDPSATSPSDARAHQTREFARFYGIEQQRLATALGFELGVPKQNENPTV